MERTYEALRQRVLDQQYAIVEDTAFADYSCFWCFICWKKRAEPPHHPACLYMQLQREVVEEQ